MSRSRTAASTRMPAARSRCRATAARRRCRAGPSCSTSSPTARPPERCARMRRLEQIHWSTTRTRAWPQVLAMAFDHRAQLEEMADAAGITREHIPHFKKLCLSAARRAAAGRRRLRHPARRPARPGGARRRHRRWHLDRPPDRAAGLDSAALRGRRRCRLHAAGMADRALRQVPGVLPPGRSRGAAGGAGGAGAPPVRCGPPDRPRAAARDHPEPLRGAGRRRHARARARPVLCARRLPGLVEAARSGEPGGLGLRSPPRSSATIRTAAACCFWAWTPRRPSSRRASRSPRASRCARASRSAARSSARRRAPGCRARSTTRPRPCAWPTTYASLIAAWERARASSGIARRHPTDRARGPARVSSDGQVRGSRLRPHRPHARAQSRPPSAGGAGLRLRRRAPRPRRPWPMPPAPARPATVEEILGAADVDGGADRLVHRHPSRSAGARGRGRQGGAVREADRPRSRQGRRLLGADQGRATRPSWSASTAASMRRSRRCASASGRARSASSSR